MSHRSAQLGQVGFYREGTHFGIFTWPYAHGVKEGERCDKHRGENPKLTFNELMAKYVKTRDAKITAQPSNMKPFRSPPQHKSKEWNRQGSKSYASSMSYGSSPAAFHHPYSSWEWHGTWAQPPSYYAPCYFKNATLRRPQPHVKARFDQTNQPGIQTKKKVAKQVYCVMKDNCKSRSSDLFSSYEKSNVTTSTLVNIGKDVKQQVIDKQGAKSEPMKLEMLEIKEKLPMHKSEVQPRCPLNLSNWQMKKLQKLSAEKLKEKNMAWVPNQRVQI
jgi:hypothetical protein